MRKARLMLRFRLNVFERNPLEQDMGTGDDGPSLKVDRHQLVEGNPKAVSAARLKPAGET